MKDNNDKSINSVVQPRKILKSITARPRKSMGQNFLISESVLSQIFEHSGVKNGDIVIEVGPGLGALTNVLLNNGIKVFAFEKDQKLASFLKEYFINDNLDVVCTDVLKYDWTTFFSEHRFEKPFHVISNLPYNVCIPIIFSLLKHSSCISDLTVMLQKEVADRMLASSTDSEYGALTVNLALHAGVTRLFDVSAKNFFPIPKVESSVVKITPYNYLNGLRDDTDKVFFDKIVHAIFTGRRKTLKNVLLMANFEKDKIFSSLKTIDIDPQIRGESLNFEQMTLLTKTLRDVSV